jgi:hypothetical protein
MLDIFFRCAPDLQIDKLSVALAAVSTEIDMVVMIGWLAPPSGRLNRVLNRRWQGILRYLG